MVECDPITLETGLPDIFACGDAVTGPATVVDAIASGKRVAVSIDRYLRGQDLKAGREKGIKLVEEVPKKGVEKRPRQTMPVIPAEKRIHNFEEVETGFTEEMALQEAERCLNCGGCSECLECEKACEPKAIVHDQKEEVIQVDVGAIILATGFDPFDPSGIKEYGYGKHQNVLSSMDLERLLSASGPTSGHLLRPSDKETPHKIAFIQCVGSRSLKGEYPYCSSVCCMYATKEAALIKEHERDSDTYIFYTDIRAFGKGFRQFVNRAESEWGVKYIRAKPSELREEPKTKDLLINYEDTLTGEIKTLQAELVVLCTGLVPHQDNRKLADTLSIEVDEYGFFEVPNQLQVPMDSTSPGVFLCGCCQGPKDIPDSIAQAKGAAARAAEFIARTDSSEALR
jgi:heterodisulfide reductase subunit A-like polyferredoxin